MKKNILNILDFQRINILLEGFNKTTGFVTAILDLEGNVLSKSGWRSICTEFHRTHPKTSKRCTISDTELAGKLAEGEKYHFYKCLNGLVDVAVPIVIKGKHIGNLFTGQFFFEKPDNEFFKKQAKKYAFDEKKYLDALDQVPVIDEAQVKIALDFLLSMTQLIVDMTSQKLEHTELIEALKNSEERWKYALEGAGDGVWDWNAQTNEVYFSDQWKAMLGYAPEEIGNNLEEWDKRVHPDDKEQVYIDLNKHLNNQSLFYQNEHRVLCKNNSYKWVLDRGKVIKRTKDGKPIRVIGAHSDISERKNAEKELLENKLFFEQLFIQSNTSTQLLDPKGWCIMINPKLSELFGVKAEDIEGRKYNILKDEEIIQTGVINHLKRVFENKESVKWEVNFDIKHASESTGVKVSKPIRRWFRNVSYPILNADGELIYVIVQHEDITEYKQAEEKLKQSENRFKKLFNNASIGIIVCELIRDDKGKIVDYIHLQANKAIYTHAGITEADVVGKRCSEVIPPEETAPFIEMLTKVLETGKPYSYQQNFPSLGRTIEHRPFIIEKDSFAITFFDITEQKLSMEEIKNLNAELEQRVTNRTAALSKSQKALMNLVEDLNEKSAQLEKSTKLLENKNKELETFTYSVSHDLKAPLRGIDGYSQILLREYGHHLDDEGKRFLTVLRESALQMNQLINDLLQYSRLERQTMRPSGINLKTSIDILISAKKTEINFDKYTFNVEIPEIEIFTDKDALNLTLRNLLENAFKFTRESANPKIEIGYQDDEKNHTIFVKDNGIGFDMKFHDRIFQIFQRLQRSEDYEGTGIGLAMVSKAMERIQGKVWAKSIAGKGATFFIQIPKKLKNETYEF